MTTQLSALLTDFYQLTMMQAYFDKGFNETAVFECFVRRLPPTRNFLVCAGVDQVLNYLEALHFSEDELRYLKSSGQFSQKFLDYLADFRFEGDVHAMPEGHVFFPTEPVLRITAPIIQAQFIESRLLNLMHYQISVASKAARCALVAPGKQLVDFGFRRAHGSEAGVLASRAAFIGGFQSTATVEAGRQFGIPVIGTMAHSFIQCHGNEAAAFADFAQIFPENVILLIDTYDTITGAQHAVSLAQQLAKQNIKLKGVRIDSGDLVVLSKQVRQMLDEAGLVDTIIFASGNLDEYSLKTLLAAGAPIDGFGIGTNLTTINDAPSCDAVYKLQEYAGQARRKLSPGKATWPGRKQIFRHYADDLMSHDVLALDDEKITGEPLLSLVMKKGLRQRKTESLAVLQQRLQADLSRLPQEYCHLDIAHLPYSVHISDGLKALTEAVDSKIQD